MFNKENYKALGYHVSKAMKINSLEDFLNNMDREAEVINILVIGVYVYVVYK